MSEYVIRGNTAVLKCNIPSFVADFVKVDAWIGSDDTEFHHSGEIGNAQCVTHTASILLTAYIPYYNLSHESILAVVNQFYEAEILTEYVIRGNAAILKCSIPSFVADFVKVEAWIADDGNEISYSDELGITLIPPFV